MNYKNHFIIFAFAFMLTFYSHAQIDKGTWMVGGNLSGASFKNESSDTNRRTTNIRSSFSILPQAGYFVTKNILVGGSIGYTYSNSVSESDNTSNNTPYAYAINQKSRNLSQNFQFGLLAGYYIPLNERIYFNTYFKIGYSTPLFTTSQSKTIYSDGTASEYTTDNSKLNSGILSMILEPGLSFFVTKKLAIEASLGILNYTNNFTKDSSPVQRNSNISGFSFGINSISLGIRYFIPKKA